jgi:dTDP-glucose pyrophosphorylase
MKAIVLSAGRVHESLVQFFGEIPTGLIPVNGKPIILKIIKGLSEITEIDEIIITVSFNKELLTQIVETYFYNLKIIRFVESDHRHTPTYSFKEAIKSIPESYNDGIVVFMADTIIPNNHILENLKNNVVFVSQTIEHDIDRWSSVIFDSKSGDITSFHDKNECSLEESHTVVGAYLIKNISLLKSISFQQFPNFELIKILEEYNKSYRIKAVQVEDWLDFGHLDTYQNSKKRLLESRFFNSLMFNDLYGTITKKSLNRDKFIKEIEWQLNIPKNLYALIPKIIDYELGEEPFIEMEYYSYPTISELWLYSSFNLNIIKSAINKSYLILKEFLNEKRFVSKEDYEDIYINKTNNRVTSILEEDSWKALFAYKEIICNGISYKNWDDIKQKIFKEVGNLYNINHNCLIHGDFCFSNILYDANSGVVRLIDPRGIWGQTPYGDIKYDVAKLRHSICGEYDFVVNDLFKLIRNSENEIQYEILSNKTHMYIGAYFDQLISKDFDLRQIKLIEGLLFLSMIPLHSTTKERQVIMYVKALMLLNEVYVSSTL